MMQSGSWCHPISWHSRAQNGTTTLTFNFINLQNANKTPEIILTNSVCHGVCQVYDGNKHKRSPHLLFFLGREVSGALRFVIVTCKRRAMKQLGIYIGFWSNDITIRRQNNIIKMNHQKGGRIRTGVTSLITKTREEVLWYGLEHLGSTKDVE